MTATGHVVDLRLNTRCTTTKNSGTKNTPSTVPTIMPPSTPVPIA